MLVRFWRDKDGRKPVGEYMRALPRSERQKLAAVFQRIQEHGLAAADTRQIDGRLWEIRADAQRAFYVLVSGAEIVVLHACRKKSRRAPAAELALARARMEQVLGRGA